MVEGGSRARHQPAPPDIVRAALLDPDRDPVRPWLVLLADEQRPRVLEHREDTVVWSSLWPTRPDAQVRFDLPPDRGGSGTDLRWTLLLEEPLPDPLLLGHLRKRLNLLINGNLRYTFGQ